jgi:hypothetical protein
MIKPGTPSGNTAVTPAAGARAASPVKTVATSLPLVPDPCRTISSGPRAAGTRASQHPRRIPATSSVACSSSASPRLISAS